MCKNRSSAAVIKVIVSAGYHVPSGHLFGSVGEALGDRGGVHIMPYGGLENLANVIKPQGQEMNFPELRTIVIDRYADNPERCGLEQFLYDLDENGVGVLPRILLIGFRTERVAMIREIYARQILSLETCSVGPLKAVLFAPLSKAA